MESKGYIAGINGPVVTIKGLKEVSMLEMLYVGNLKLTAEVIKVYEDFVIGQVYESTTGLKLGEPVLATGSPLSLTLGPGIIGQVFDGIQRPLKALEQATGGYIGRGIETFSIDRDREWQLELKIKEGDYLRGGQIFAQLKETDLITHYLMLAPDKEGRVKKIIRKNTYKVLETVFELENEFGRIEEINLVQYWPVRKARPIKERFAISKPLITGQRVIDTFFPIAKGGAAAIPGGFGTGKTMTQHQLAKWSDADIIVYIGCGERGNEITDVLEEFPKLIDPKSNKPLMDRTVLIANTSNMPVAAREASIYTGITIAEYYRDMGYHVAIMADSTSRWAEALREISGRLEEMPAEEGFPSYLPSRLSQFYERAGYARALSDRESSVSIIGAVSPQGGDFSEPVTQNTKRFIRAFWALDSSLAYSRHYPAINWLNSYSEYNDDLKDWYDQKIGQEFYKNKTELLALLQEEDKLMEIVKLIGSDILPESQKLVLEIAKLLRLGFLQQNAFHELDTYSTLKKQNEMLGLILHLYDLSKKLVAKGIPVSVLLRNPIFSKLMKIKYELDNEDDKDFLLITKEIDDYYKEINNSYKDFERIK